MTRATRAKNTKKYKPEEKRNTNEGKNLLVLWLDFFLFRIHSQVIWTSSLGVVIRHKLFFGDVHIMYCVLIIACKVSCLLTIEVMTNS